jgi:glycosyltransferase involved in cell wall biosynthesis
MKFLIYSHTSTFFGAPKSMLELTEELKKNGHKFLFVLPNNKGEYYEVLIKKGYDVVILENPLWIKPNVSESYSKYYLFKHSVKQSLYFFYVFFNSLRKHKKNIKNYAPDFLIINSSVSPLGIIVGALFKVKTILWLREALGSSKESSIPTLFPSFLVSKILNLASIKIATSNFIYNHFVSNYNLENILTIGNPISLINKQKEKKELDFSIGMVGSLSSRKGQIDFLKLANPNLYSAIHIFGNGPNTILKQIEEIQNLKKGIVFHGFSSNIREIYDSFTIYVNLGVDEAFGRTTIEAMNMGCLVFGKKSGATSELINHGENGFLFNEIEEVFEIINKIKHGNKSYDVNLIREQAINKSQIYTPDLIAKEFISQLLNNKICK